LEKAETLGIVQELRSTMKNLEYISVRDQNTSDFVESILDRKAEMNVDPVFISSFDRFIPTLKARRPYMLVYAYANRISDPREIATIQSYAKKNKLDIICVGMQQRWCSNNIAASAFELLSYVKNAQCIVTDTFHGTVFSIKYNKKFVSLIRDSNSEKLSWLLNQFGAMSRNVTDLDTFELVMDSDIDYDRINAVIDSEQKKAYKYLDKVTCGED
jgi:hypothetical protein